MSISMFWWFSKSGREEKFALERKERKEKLTLELEKAVTGLGEAEMMEGVLEELNSKSGIKYALDVDLYTNLLLGGDRGDPRRKVYGFKIGDHDTADKVLNVRISFPDLYVPVEGYDGPGPAPARVSEIDFKQALVHNLTREYTLHGETFWNQDNSPERAKAKLYLSKKLGEEWYANGGVIKTKLWGDMADRGKGSGKYLIRQFEKEEGWNDIEPHEMVSEYRRLTFSRTYAPDEKDDLGVSLPEAEKTLPEPQEIHTTSPMEYTIICGTSPRVPFNLSSELPQDCSDQLSPNEESFIDVNVKPPEAEGILPKPPEIHTAPPMKLG